MINNEETELNHEPETNVTLESTERDTKEWTDGEEIDSPQSETQDLQKFNFQPGKMSLTEHYLNILRGKAPSSFELYTPTPSAYQLNIGYMAHLNEEMKRDQVRTSFGQLSPISSTEQSPLSEVYHPCTQCNNTKTNDSIDSNSNIDCTQCDKGLKTKFNLDIQTKMAAHSNSRPFVCPTCGKGFRLSSTLCRHKIIHTTQRPHKCYVCHKSFNRSSTLKTHLRTHSSTKEYSCHVCGKGFHQKGNLRNHSLIHTGEKPWKCEICLKHFNKLSNLKFHMHSHTDQKPYRCRFCKHAMARRGELKQHIAQYHSQVNMQQ